MYAGSFCFFLGLSVYFSPTDYNWEVIAIEGGIIFVHANLLAVVENAALKKITLFQAQNDVLANLPNCSASYLSLEKELLLWYMTMHYTFPIKCKRKVKLHIFQNIIALAETGCLDFRSFCTSCLVSEPFLYNFFPIVKANSWLHCSCKHLSNLCNIFIHLCFYQILILHYCQDNFPP